MTYLLARTTLLVGPSDCCKQPGEQWLAAAEATVAVKRAERTTEPHGAHQHVYHCDSIHFCVLRDLNKCDMAWWESESIWGEEWAGLAFIVSRLQQ